MNLKLLKTVSLGLSIAGGVASLIAGTIDSKLTDSIIAEKVSEAISKMNK